MALIGCASPFVLLLLLMVGSAISRGIAEYKERRAIAEQAEQTAKRLRDQQRQSYSIEDTVRIMLEMDSLMANSSVDLLTYLESAARVDFTPVASEVTLARAKLIEEYTELYLTLKDEEARAEAFDDYRWSLENALSILLDVRNPVTTEGAEQRGTERLSLLADRLQQRAATNEKVRRLRFGMLETLGRYYTVYRKYFAEWDRFCLKRDKAYLAASRRDWKACAELAAQCLEKSPGDVESMMLFCSSTMERQDRTKEEIEEVGNVLDRLEKSGQATAPALVLRGRWHGLRGNPEEARGSFELAKTRYSEQLKMSVNRADLYSVRAYLRETTEGNAVLNQFRSTQIGSGYYSPELQSILLTLKLEQPVDLGRRLDKHLRSRLEQESRVREELQKIDAQIQNAQVTAPDVSFWDLFGGKKTLLKIEAAVRAAQEPLKKRRDWVRNTSHLQALQADLEFCQLHGWDKGQFREEVDGKVRYLVSARISGAGAKPGNLATISLDNRTGKPLRNVAVILGLRFTDQERGFYYYHECAPTQALVGGKPGWVPLSSPTQIEVDGKGVKEIVEAFAIILADEGMGLVPCEVPKK